MAIAPVVFTPDQLRELVRLYGADRILMGTDYPSDMGEYDPVGHICKAGFDAETTAAICGGNVSRLRGCRAQQASAALRRSSRERSVQCAFGLLHPTF